MTINELTIVIAAWSLLSGASRSKGGVTLVRKISQEWTTFSLNDFQKTLFLTCSSTPISAVFLQYITN